MNQFTQLLLFIKSLSDADDFVNTTTKHTPDEIDVLKANLFPIFNINVSSGSFPSTGVIEFNVELACLDIRDINKEINDDKFWRNDNEVDNLNETLATLNRVWVAMNRDWAGNNITASDSPTFTATIGEGANIYDGWVMTFDVQLPNVTLNLCT
tara:strand:+ start:7486 stop:7947 length:462 start_codon:yes stop_codon:yes gene_type:complete